MEIKLKINVDTIFTQTGILIESPEQWLALIQYEIDFFKFNKKDLTKKQGCKLDDLCSFFENATMI